ncbi:TPA: restriction endonuclease subunit S [Vibrio vulnificus]|uniref:restriction endonuclease subunit S n=1 Tax=Vibrio vulnificus TaxID=672 RepID=UPI001A2D2080|nr:restriction endonuclease subunit S [Vibrio vulnificus]EGQ7992001.1 restriction endonuclease subunit S [Vibrio vulnificus]MCU8400872.1 restriction endonuclease subunit S [Vibrio vulnificus]MDS1781721.1 restriction endonuclease subunit S [Vibrio vulnificus]MDS1808981.1 restriction endonuclease subunit S [Vibrio vulnificus]HAS6247731.1 restriction endonuclease subunit S [Vibrio vulnificus]
MTKILRSTGWLEAKLEQVLRLSTGKLDANAAVTGGDYPFFTCAEQALRIDSYAFDTDAVLLAGNGSFSVKRYSGKFNAYQRTYVLEPRNIELNYLYWAIRENITAITSSERGSTIPYIRKGDILEVSIAIPPLAEQKVISEKLDTLLAQVEVTKARLESALETLKQFRQSVLAAAVSGKLTEDWRDSSLPQWQKVKLIDVLESKPRNGKSPKGVDYETPYRNLTLSSTTTGKFIENQYKFVELDIDSDSYLWVKNGDILIQRANTIDYVGVSAIYEGEDDKYVYPDLIMKCRSNESALGKYIHLALSSEKVRKYFRDNATGTAGNMPKINQQVVSNAPISLPTLAEQHEIVSRVARLFASADATEQQVNQALERVNNLTKSILAKAFRGELTEQWRKENPELISGENSAEALLKKIKAERAAAKPKRKARATSS